MSNRKLNGKNLMMPMAAFTMAGILFVYTRLSIRSAKMNAARHREADGGQISWQKQSMRQHGQLESPQTSILEGAKPMKSSLDPEPSVIGLTEQGVRSRKAEGRGT
ncbi:hypothetical protein DFH27DRAFT_535292 [Peziza echinospora]|nr:hypothetical protein DFH27DRAFT_535292 [Peziza echinospora]